jgi:hypothetical protein
MCEALWTQTPGSGYVCRTVKTGNWLWLCVRHCEHSKLALVMCEANWTQPSGSGYVWGKLNSANWLSLCVRHIERSQLALVMFEAHWTQPTSSGFVWDQLNIAIWFWLCVRHCEHSQISLVMCEARWTLPTGSGYVWGTVNTANWLWLFVRHTEQSQIFLVMSETVWTYPTDSGYVWGTVNTANSSGYTHSLSAASHSHPQFSLTTTKNSLRARCIMQNTWKRYLTVGSYATMEVTNRRFSTCGSPPKMCRRDPLWILACWILFVHEVSCKVAFCVDVTCLFYCTGTVMFGFSKYFVLLSNTLCSNIIFYITLFLIVFLVTVVRSVLDNSCLMGGK